MWRAYRILACIAEKKCGAYENFMNRPKQQLRVLMMDDSTFLFCVSAWQASGFPVKKFHSILSLRLVLHSKTPVLGNAIPVLGVKLKRGWYVFWLFFMIDPCSATSFKRSRRELSINVAEDRSILKNIAKIRSIPSYVSRPKQVANSLKRVFRFYCVWRNFVTPPFNL